MRFDHIGVVVRDLPSGRALLRQSFGIAEWSVAFTDPVNDVLVQFGRCPSGICYEAIASLSPESPVARVLAKRINVINHVAYLVDDLDTEAARLAAAGFASAGPARPAIAYGQARIQFFVSPEPLMMELIEAPDHEHAYAAMTEG